MSVHGPLERGRVHEPVRTFRLQGQPEQGVVQDGLRAAAAAAAAANRHGRRFSRVGGVWNECFNRFMLVRGGKGEGAVR